MARNRKQKKVQQKAKPVKKVEEVKTEEAPSVETATHVTEIVKELGDILKKHEASGYALVVADKSGKVLPYAACASIGDLLALQYTLNKEVSRLIDKSTSTQQA